MAYLFPDEKDIHSVSPDYKCEGTDWYAVFNPNVKRRLDVQLVHTLLHEGYVRLLPIGESWKLMLLSCLQCSALRQVLTQWQILGNWL